MIIKRKNKEQYDSMVVGQGHTIMAGYIPPSIEPATFSENYYKWAKPTPESISQFGLFGGDIDYNTYYPDMDPAELKPKDEEFIEPMFRLLSATIVSKNYNPTDFSVPGVLKASLNLLLGQTVNCDHETNIGNAIGAVSQVMWQEAYKEGNFTIPAGINGVLKIDGKANPRIARGILMEPPSIHSNSVTVQFKWDKSHPNMEDNEFYHKLGTYDSKGNMIRRMVTEIIRYHETSLVSHGADSFAQKIGSDGKIINPTFAKRTWSSYAEYQEDQSKQFYFSDFKSYEDNNETSEFNNEGNELHNPENMNELTTFIESLFAEDGLFQLKEGQEMNKETVVSYIQELMDSKTKLSNEVKQLTDDKVSLTDQITKLNAEVANLKDMATVGTNYIASLREKAVETYKKLMGDSVDETIVTMLNAETTGLNTIVSLMKDYESRLNEKFPLTCSKCGSKDVSRSSSVVEEVDETTKNQEEVDSTQSVMKQLYNQKL